METVNENTLIITEYRLLGKLPDPFVTDGGERIADPGRWPERRREIYRTAVELQYGTLPPEPEIFEVELTYTSPKCNVYIIHAGTREKQVSFRMKLIMPPEYDGKFPVIVDGDGCWMYCMDRDFLSPALDNGIAWAFFDRTELAHDLQNEGRGRGALYGVYPEYGFGAIGAWAWGYSRCVDALEKINAPVDPDWIAFTGHSRGGKTAALAGAVDERAKIVNPNATCAGACGCYRIHMKGFCNPGKEARSETLADIVRAFPFWFGKKLPEYADREEQLPFDAHFLKAMIAPRTLFVSEAAGDLWSNPVGSYQTTKAAGEVFRFLGVEENLFWYFRPGTHSHSVSDVQMLVNVILHQKRGEPVDERMFILPFAEPEPAYDWTCPNGAAQSV